MTNPIAGLTKQQVDAKLFYEGDSFRLDYMVYILGHGMTRDEIDRAIYADLTEKAVRKMKVNQE